MRPKPSRPLAGVGSRIARDTHGAAITEFAIIAPALLITLLGLFDVSYNIYTKALLEGAVQKAARDSTIEGADEHRNDINERLERAVKDLAPHADVTIERRSYADFSGVARPEDFVDSNNDGVCNDGEAFEDANGNGIWDADRGREGFGGARDAVHFTVRVEYDRLFPLAGLIGLPPVVTTVGHTVLRNQPYGPQNMAAAVGNCP